MCDNQRMSPVPRYRRLPAWVALACMATALSAPLARAKDPSWYKKKKKDQAVAAEEQAVKDAEKPAVSGDASEGDQKTVFSELTKEEAPKYERYLLFKRAGMTDSLGFHYGTLDQPDLPGRTFNADYSMGWWATPFMVASMSVQGSTIFDSGYIFMMFVAGPKFRYFLKKNVAVTGFVGYGVSQSLSRANKANLPYPPGHIAYGARQGFQGTAQLAYLFWPKRDVGFGPALTFWGGNQSERRYWMITLGITYQAGRPPYGGDLTGAW